MKQFFAMFAGYNQWANTAIYDAAVALSAEEFTRDTGAFFGSAMRTLNHLLVADRIWQNRFTGTGPKPTALDEILFPELSELRAARIAEDQRIIDWISSLSEAELAGTFTYTPITSPQPVTQRLGPAVAHMFNHQTHHRGQLHSILTTLGQPSLTLDLIYFQRTDEGRAFG